jgi:hypothetical protein
VVREPRVNLEAEGLQEQQDHWGNRDNKGQLEDLVQQVLLGPQVSQALEVLMANLGTEANQEFLEVKEQLANRDHSDHRDNQDNRGSKVIEVLLEPLEKQVPQEPQGRQVLQDKSANQGNRVTVAR